MCSTCKKEHPELYIQLQQAYEEITRLKNKRKVTEHDKVAAERAVTKWNAAMKSINKVHDTKKCV